MEKTWVSEWLSLRLSAKLTISHSLKLFYRRFDRSFQMLFLYSCFSFMFPGEVHQGFLAIVMDHAAAGDLLKRVDVAKKQQQPLQEEKGPLWSWSV